MSGGNSEKVTPVPIPNTVVKLLCADDTWWVTAWESKSSPELFIKQLALMLTAFLCVDKVFNSNCYFFAFVHFLLAQSRVSKHHSVMFVAGY